MDTVSVVEARKNLSDLMAKVAYSRQRVVVERNGKPMAALVSIEDLRRLEALDRSADSTHARREAALVLAGAARQRIREERGGIPLPDSAEVLNELREEQVRGATEFGC